MIFRCLALRGQHPEEQEVEMSDAPERIWVHPHYKDWWDAGGWTTTSKQSGGKWTEYIRRDAPELVALVDAANQARLYFRGLVSADSAIRKLDNALAAWEKINDR